MYKSISRERLHQSLQKEWKLLSYLQFNTRNAYMPNVKEAFSIAINIALDIHDLCLLPAIQVAPRIMELNL